MGNLNAVDNRPPKHERTLKCGDTRADGMRFWRYAQSCPTGEWWVTNEKFEEKITKGRERRVRYQQTEEYRVKQRAHNARYLQTEGGRAKQRARQARYYATPEGKVVYAVRQSAYRAAKFAGQNKPSRSFELLGTDLEGFRAHIESLFTDGMCWEKMGGEIHIDHIVPLASAKGTDEIWDLCHYTNLQPLWGPDNLSKGAKMPEDQ